MYWVTEKKIQKAHTKFPNLNKVLIVVLYSQNYATEICRFYHFTNLQIVLNTQKIPT